LVAKGYKQKEEVAIMNHSLL